MKRPNKEDYQEINLATGLDYWPNEEARNDYEKALEQQIKELEEKNEVLKIKAGNLEDINGMDALQIKELKDEKEHTITFLIEPLAEKITKLRASLKEVEDERTKLVFDSHRLLVEDMHKIEELKALLVDACCIDMSNSKESDEWFERKYKALLELKALK